MKIQVVCPEGHPVSILASKLGADVACPKCSQHFVAKKNVKAASQANAAKGKARSARDEDDDEVEEIEEVEEAAPQKKVKAVIAKKKEEKNAKVEKSEEKERPKLKKPVRKKRDEEEDDDEDDEDDEDEDEEGDEEEEAAVEIEWTPRKRQLNVVRNSLVGNIVAFWTLVAATLLAAAKIGLGLIEQFGIPMIQTVPWADDALKYTAAGLVGIAFTAFLVSWIMSFWAPAKSEMRGGIILAIIFLAMPAFLLALSQILIHNDVFDKASVRDNFANLIFVGCSISLFVSLFFGMSALSKLCLFMGDKKLSSQPITLCFGVIGFTVLIGALIFLHGTLWLMYSTPKAELRNDFYNYIAFALAALCFGAIFFLLRTLHGMVAMCQTLRKHIQTYIETQ